jgi:3-oxoacyl-[acyl-carrier-protein] synthase II
LTRGGLFVASGKEEVPAEEIADAMRACLDGDKISPVLLGSQGLRVFHPLSLLRVMPNTGQFGISALFGFRGPNLNLVASGAAGGQAVGEAFRSLREESCDFAIAGAQDSRIDPISFAAFESEGLLSRRTADPGTAMRPFDASRDGFAIGEGAACLLLETMPHAQARSAHARARVTGYASTTDSDGRGIARAIESALADASIVPPLVDVVFAWGDCTPRGDFEEASALRKVFASQAAELPVCCVKPVTGNMLSASAVAELAVAVLALEAGVIPPTMNHRVPDPACALTGLSEEPRPGDLAVALCLSRGLHGQTVALVLERL